MTTIFITIFNLVLVGVLFMGWYSSQEITVTTMIFFVGFMGLSQIGCTIIDLLKKIKDK